MGIFIFYWVKKKAITNGLGLLERLRFFELGETPIKTAIREFHEETAMIFKNIPLEKQLMSIEPVIDKTPT